MAKTQSKTAGKKVVKKKEKRNVPHGVAHIQASFNNTIISISDPLGNMLSWASSGNQNFRGTGRARRSPLRSLPASPPKRPKSRASVPWTSVSRGPARVVRAPSAPSTPPVFQ